LGFDFYAVDALFVLATFLNDFSALVLHLVYLGLVVVSHLH
jgi:hypothetical protein